MKNRKNSVLSTLNSSGFLFMANASQYDQGLWDEISFRVMRITISLSTTIPCVNLFLHSTAYGSLPESGKKPRGHVMKGRSLQC
jgi:hypothetical protein